MAAATTFVFVFVFVFPFAFALIVVDLGSLDPTLEPREVSLEELAAWTFSCGCDDGGGGAGLELRGASKGGGEGYDSA
jgi:hypothetical protein